MFMVFKNAYFSGLPTIEIAEILYKKIFYNKQLNGILHISGQKISKLNLLRIISEVYEKRTKIYVESKFKIDRSLDSNKFILSGYKQKSFG